MTGFFNSRSGSSVRNYHYYTVSDTKLRDIGLASYTRNSLENFGKRKRNGVEDFDPDIKEYLGNVEGIKPKLLGDSADLIIYRFDKPTNRYLLTTNRGAGEDNIFWVPSGERIAYNSLKVFQEKFDLYQKGFISIDSDNIVQQQEALDIKYIWSKINNSLSGCINFRVANYTILGGNYSCQAQLFFQSKSDGSNRGLAFQPPVIAGVGKLATGQEHAFNISETLPAGSFSGPDVGGNKNPNNTIAGELNLHFNRGTGKWESGTSQVYAQVIDYIPGVPPIDLPKSVDSVDNEALRLPFSSGIAIVMNDEKGNPHLCVPTSFGCQPAAKTKIVLVNRTPRSYEKGEKILASQINGSWIPTPLENGKSVSKKLVFEWSQIQKYIVNARGFFRDSVDGPTKLDPELYSDVIRARFYNTLGTANIERPGSSDLSRLRLLNLIKVGVNQDGLPIYDVNNGIINMNGKDDGTLNQLGVTRLFGITPSFEYKQFFDADLISTSLGGNNALPLGMLRSTNISKSDIFSPDVGVEAATVPTSWGMYFPDGYYSSDVARLISTRSVVSNNPSMNIYTNTSLNFAPFTNTVQTSALNLKDIYFYHMPAQFALNGYNNQSIRWIQLNDITAGNLIAYIKQPVKGDWLKTSSGRDAYKLTPVNSSKVQFTPLSIELALSSAIIKDEGLGQIKAENGGYKDLRDQLIKARSVANDISFKSFGKAWDRIGIGTGRIIMEADGSVESKITFGKKLKHDVLNTVGPPARGDAPDGGPGLIPHLASKESSNVLGIIAAKATFSSTQGGNIEVKVDHKIGTLAYTQSTMAGTSDVITGLLGIFGFSVTAGNGLSKTFRYTQWGGSLGDEQISELGTTSLWCSVYDHCPNTAYDGRYFAPLQFNPSGTSMDFKQVTLAPNAIVNSGTKITTETVTVRRNMLLSNGGFAYIKKVIVAGTPRIVKRGENYVVGNKLTFALGGKPATFIVTGINGSNVGPIATIEPDPDLGIEAFGETGDGGTANPLKSGYISAVGGDGIGADIRLEFCKVIEKIYVDRIKFYGSKKVSTSDNNGEGNDRGFVVGTKNTSFALEPNSTGKYDIFFFFVSDIANYPEAGILYEGYEAPPARYLNVEITSA